MASRQMYQIGRAGRLHTIVAPMAAASEKQVACLNVLVEAGADLNVPTTRLQMSAWSDYATMSCPSFLGITPAV